MDATMTRFLPALAILFTLVACNRPPSAPVNFKIAVIVDTTSDPVTRAQAEAILAIADKKFVELTGYGLELVGFVEDQSGSPVADLIENYIEQHSPLPNGILVFSVGDDQRANTHRAYAQQVPGPDGFRNAFVSPYLGDEFMYVAVLNFNYRYAACGYGGTDAIQSQVSSGGECPGPDGQACAEWEGMQVCPSALPFLEGHTPVDIAAGPLIHEFMHAFGDKGSDDHYTSEACRQAMGWAPDHYDVEEAEYYNDFCPYVYDVFANSYRP
jgi:putative hemolysin